MNIIHKSLLMTLLILNVYTIKENVSFTIHNDLKYTVTLHIGKNTVVIKQGTSYKFNKKEGTKIYLYKNNQKEKLLLIVQKDLIDKKINLSKLLKE